MNIITVGMSHANHRHVTPDMNSGNQESLSPRRLAFIRYLNRDGIAEKAKPHYLRWAESWTKARGHESPERSRAYFEALIGENRQNASHGNSSINIADWQFRQAVEAARILAVEIMRLAWA